MCVSSCARSAHIHTAAHGAQINVGTATLTRGHNYVISRSFTFPLGRAGPPFGFGFGVVRKMVLHTLVELLAS